MTDPVHELQRIARQPVGHVSVYLRPEDIEAGVNTAAKSKSTRPGHALRRAGAATLTALAVITAGVGVAYAARPVSDAFKGAVIGAHDAMMHWCLRGINGPSR